MELKSQKPKNPPWYEGRDHWLALATRYIDAFRRLPADAPHHAELRAFSDLSAMRLVFESNLIESAGLSKGDTRKVIEENFPNVPSTYEAFRGASALTNQMAEVALDFTRLNELLQKLGRKDLIPSFRFQGRSRSIIEVMRHYAAYLQAQNLVLSFLLADRLRSAFPEDEARQKWEHAGGDYDFDVTRRLIGEWVVKNLHEHLAEGLLPADAGVPAGAYRIDARSVGLDLSFPSPELVPPSMKQFEERSEKILAGGSHPVVQAAAITYDFLMIHPFPDFNGRVSRLLLAMVLFGANVPFPVTLRGGSPWKQRYLYALRRANRGDLRPYEAPIARRLVESFEEVDENVKRAGLPSLLSFSPKVG